MLHAFQELGLSFLFFSFSPSLCDQVYGALSGDAVLRPTPMDLPIQRIVWKHNDALAAEWRSGDTFQCLGKFEGRCEVNTTTGELTIKRLELTESGDYTPEINDKVLNQIELSVISRVAKPSVKSSCNTEMTSCLLTCEGSTTNAKPVFYKWFLDGRDGPSRDDLIITKDIKKNRFSCMMRNPVSNETSESITNPFIKQIYGTKGEDVILRPPPMTDTVQSIEWKHNEDIAVDWYGDGVWCFGLFKGRCEVDTGTGELTIRELNLNDSGIYTAEINYKDSHKTQLSVISRVAKPSVKTSCDTKMTRCILTCEGNTAEAEPITYMWLIDGEHGPSNDVFYITEDTKENLFTCLMKNPVSSDASESVPNPIIIERERVQLIAIIVSATILVIIVVAAFFIYKHARGRKQRPPERTLYSPEEPTILHLRDSTEVAVFL